MAGEIQEMSGTVAIERTTTVIGKETTETIGTETMVDVVQIDTTRIEGPDTEAEMIGGTVVLEEVIGDEAMVGGRDKDWADSCDKFN